LFWSKLPQCKVWQNVFRKTRSVPLRTRLDVFKLKHFKGNTIAYVAFGTTILEYEGYHPWVGYPTQYRVHQGYLIISWVSDMFSTWECTLPTSRVHLGKPKTARTILVKLRSCTFEIAKEARMHVKHPRTRFSSFHKDKWIVQETHGAWHCTILWDKSHKHAQFFLLHNQLCCEDSTTANM
jgi:hypothetical protein